MPRMADSDFDADLLIDAVRRRPQLYTKYITIEPAEKNDLWKEIGAEYYDDWETYDKATAYDKVLYLMKKWRSLRDAYNRELRIRRSSTASTGKRRVYMHYHKMKFLKDAEDAEKDEDDDEEDDKDNGDNSASELNETKVRKAKRSRYSKRSKSTTEDSDNSDNNTRQEHLQQSAFAEVDLPVVEETMDADKLFLMSFLPEMRQLPPNLKMWARTQIASIMQEVVTSHYTGQPLAQDRKLQPEFNSII